ncbi:MAG TPA: hypothetical protein VFB12_12795, partial [Ktedonobacteraceae bacterium]|nr:hypothetical protein [Ktedonobacteraceae bacterium]
FDSTRELPLNVTMAIQRDLSQIDPAPFQYIQAYTKSPDLVSHKVRGHVGPIPGAYHMIYGHLPVPEATVAEVLQGARKTLERNTNFIANTSEDLLGHGGGRLERSIRFMCTDVWPTLYSMLTLRAEQPLAIWRLPKEAAIARLLEDEPAGTAIRQFYHRVYAYYNSDHSLESALAVIEQGVEFLQAADLWYREEYAQ